MYFNTEANGQYAHDTINPYYIFVTTYSLALELSDVNSD